MNPSRSIRNTLSTCESSRRGRPLDRSTVTRTSWPNPSTRGIRARADRVVRKYQGSPPASPLTRLPAYARIADGESRAGSNDSVTRRTLLRITVLGFIYTTCVDPEGCPLAYRVFDTVRETIAATPALRDKVRLVTLSFDPARDSPSAMRAYAGSRVSGEAGGLPWYFLTTRSARALMPLVEGFGQDVRVTVDRSSGRPRRELSHVLKVFLIDRAGFIREIYTSTFLHPQTLLNDIETLVMEDGPAGPR